MDRRDAGRTMVTYGFLAAQHRCQRRLAASRFLRFRFVLLPAKILPISFEVFLPLGEFAILGLEGPDFAFGLFEPLFGARFVGLELASLPIQPARSDSNPA